MREATETLQQFYRRTNQPLPAELEGNGPQVSHFAVKRRSSINRCTPYNRRDYYKVCLIIGTGVYSVRGEGIPINGAALVLSHPQVPTSWQAGSEEQGGYYCL